MWRRVVACHLLTWWFLLKLFLLPCRWRRYVPPKRRLQLNRLHGVTSQKMILFKCTRITQTDRQTESKVMSQASFYFFRLKIKWGLWDHLAVCLSVCTSLRLSVYPSLIFVRKLMRSPCCLSLSVCLSSLMFSFSIMSVLYKRKVGE
jgi:hypothetical protein